MSLRPFLLLTSIAMRSLPFLVALACSVPATAQEPLRTFTSPTPFIELSGGQFGFALDVLGDLDGDAVPEVLVGAPGEDLIPGEAGEYDGATFGHAYVLSGATGDVIRTLESPNRASEDWGAYFGWAVAVMGDLDGDGVADLAVGAPLESPEPVQPDGAGAVYVFSGATGALLHTLFPPEPLVFGWFGSVLTPLGDVDGDDKEDLFVGVRSYRDSEQCDAATDADAHVFSGATGALLYSLPPAAGCAGRLGSSAAALGDLDGDGRGDFAISGFVRENGSTQYYLDVYSGAAPSLLYTITAQAEIRGLGGNRRLTALGDLDEDGAADFATLGWAADPDGGDNIWHLYVFSGATGALLFGTATPNPEDSRYFSTIGPAGDLDGDGTPDVLASDRDPSPSLPFSSGRAYAFSGATGALLQTFDPPVPRIEGLFGQALDGTTDFTGDGIPDLLIGEAEEYTEAFGGQVHLFGTVRTGTAPAPPAPPADLHLAPNPVSGMARVTWRAHSGPVRLTVYDVLGRERLALRPEGSADATFDTGRWAPGLYVLRLERADGVAFRRFTVAR